MAKAKFTIGQRVGILAGVQSAGGPHIAQYGTVVGVIETWADTLEYVVEAEDGTRLLYRSYLLAAAPADAETRAYRTARFFDGARAGRDDIAYGAYPSLGRELLTAPKFRDGVEVMRPVVNIIGIWARGTYIVQDVRRGDQWIAFTSEIRPL